jgi:hypothetical protein
MAGSKTWTLTRGSRMPPASARESPTLGRPWHSLVTEMPFEPRLYTRESTNLPPFNLSTPPPIPRTRLRSQRAPPTFNLLVCGAQLTGKTSFLQTLLGTVKLNPQQPNYAQAKHRLATFGGGSSKRRTRTRELTTCSVEILERGERIGLTVIDTPGLPVRSNGELAAAVEISV